MLAALLPGFLRPQAEVVSATASKKAVENFEVDFTIQRSHRQNASKLQDLCLEVVYVSRILQTLMGRAQSVCARF